MNKIYLFLILGCFACQQKNTTDSITILVSNEADDLRSLAFSLSFYDSSNMPHRYSILNTDTLIIPGSGYQYFTLASSQIQDLLILQPNDWVEITLTNQGYDYAIPNNALSEQMNQRYSEIQNLKYLWRNEFHRGLTGDSLIVQAANENRQVILESIVQELQQNQVTLTEMLTEEVNSSDHEFIQQFADRNQFLLFQYMADLSSAGEQIALDSCIQIIQQQDNLKNWHLDFLSEFGVKYPNFRFSGNENKQLNAFLNYNLLLSYISKINSDRFADSIDLYLDKRQDSLFYSDLHSKVFGKLDHLHDMPLFDEQQQWVTLDMLDPEGMYVIYCWASWCRASQFIDKHASLNVPPSRWIYLSADTNFETWNIYDEINGLPASSYYSGQNTVNYLTHDLQLKKTPAYIIVNNGKIITNLSFDDVLSYTDTISWSGPN